MSIGTFFEEISTLLGKKLVEARTQSIAMMGFLQMLGGTVLFLLIVLIKRESFVFSFASLPTYLVRLILEIIQAHTTILAIVRTPRTTFGFVRTLTIPALLMVDIVLGYPIGTFQIIGMAVIILTMFVLFSNHGFERKGSGLVLFTALNAVATLSLYKYHITRFNSVVGEEMPIFIVLCLYFMIYAYMQSGENPLRIFRQPKMLAQTLSQGIGVGFESFAFALAPASVILAVKRSSAILWAVISGNRYFNEKQFYIKLLGFIALAFGIVLLALPS